jgi:hypothetical protein
MIRSVRNLEEHFCARRRKTIRESPKRSSLNFIFRSFTEFAYTPCFHLYETELTQYDLWVSNYDILI